MMPSEAANRIHSQREEILRDWSNRVRSEQNEHLKQQMNDVSEQLQIDDGFLIKEVLPDFLDDLCASLSSESDDSTGNLPRMFYGVLDSETFSLSKILRELQLLRETLFKLIDAEGILASECRMQIDRFIDRSILEAAKEFETVTLEGKKLETIFATSTAGMVLWRGEDLICERVNSEFQNIFGNREILGKPFLAILPDFKERSLTKLILNVFRTGEPSVAHERIARLSKLRGLSTEDRYYDFSFMRIDDNQGKPYGIYGLAIDVTERVVARRELKTVSDSLCASREEIERANGLKSSFLANMSHEIRTPLAAILGFSSLLKDSSIDEAEKDRFIDTIIRNSNALTNLIDDILDLAKAEAGRLEIGNVDFAFHDLVIDVVDLFKNKAKLKDIFLYVNIDESTPKRLWSDPPRLRQVLINLIGNAVKFTDKGGVQINVRSTVLSEKKIQIDIEVVDSGVGLSEEQKLKVFQPFTQADNSTTRKFGGTGLGLALSQRLSRALNGEILIGPCAPGKGCSFTLTFIATQAEPTLRPLGPEALSPEEISLSGVRVLVVDDSPDNQFLVSKLLSNYGATVETAKDGLEGLNKALSDKFDIVLMDIQMPKMDGYQAKKALDERGYQKPVIALTAHAMTEERIKTKAEGFAAHVTKPVNKSSLLTTIAMLNKTLH